MEVPIRPAIIGSINRPDSAAEVPEERQAQGGGGLRVANGQVYMLDKGGSHPVIPVLIALRLIRYNLNIS